MKSMSAMFESSQRLSLSAREEALLAGRTTVGVEDLFLALFSAGGESSALLAGAGIDLPSARAAVDAVRADRNVQRADVNAEHLQPRSRPQRVLGSEKVHFSERAQRVLLEVTAYDDDRHVLVAVADSADSIVEETLNRLGIDVPALREIAAAGAADAGSGPPPAGSSAVHHEVIHDDAGAWIRATASWHLTADPQAITALVADPSQWQRWNAYGEGRLDIDDGTVTVTDPNCSRWLWLLGVRTRSSRHRLVAADAAEVVWETITESVTTKPGRRRRSRQRLRIHLEATASGTVATFESDWLLTRRPGRARRSLLGHMLTSRVTAQASAIAQVISQPSPCE